MPTTNLPELEQELAALAKDQLSGVELRPHLEIDALITLSELGGDTYQEIQLLAPFGNGNPVPKFMSKGVEVLERRTMGNAGAHLRLKLRQGGTVWDGVAFRLGNHTEELTPRIDVVYNLEADSWGGKQQLRLNILDFKKSEEKLF
jgi:single-stranded-DNA-specific exonuclease